MPDSTTVPPKVEPAHAGGEPGPSTKNNHPQVQSVFATFPFLGLPKSIKEGFSSLIILYSDGHDAGCIVDCIYNLLPMIIEDFKDPVIELALIIVIVLGEFASFPKLMEAPQEDVGKMKNTWMAVLFLKMMLFKYRRLMNTELTEKLSEYQGYQGITNSLLLNIYWVAFCGEPDTRPYPLSTVEDLVLLDSDILKERLEWYKELIADKNSSELFGEICCWN